MDNNVKKSVKQVEEVSTDKFRRQFQGFLTATEGSRKLAERDRDYADLKQWTAEESKELIGRGQAPVVFDYVREQVDYFLGAERDKRQDPRAFPRTQQHEGAADACSDALRYVADNVDFDQTASDVFENVLVEGIGACIIEPEEDGEEIGIAIRHIPWDRFYYDQHSRRRDFGDAAYMGLVVWMDQDEAISTYPDSKADIKDTLGASTIDGGTYDDKPQWADTERKRVKVCQHYYKEKGVWHVCHFSGDLMLIKPRPVPLTDENGDPICPIVAFAAYIDREGNRYGWMRRNIDPQTEVNHRRSKGLFLLSSRQVLSEDGAVEDEHEAKSELKKPDGWVRLNPGALRDGSFQIGQTGDMAQGQMAMYQDAVSKIAASGANAAMQGDVTGMSGTAIQRLQHGGQVQIGPLYDAHRNWKRRVYRQVWLAIRQFWDAPKWVRVTDDEKNLKWVGLNEPVTMGQALQESAEQGNEEAAMALQQLTQTNDPRLQQIVETRNEVAKIDVDIIIDESPDVVTVQEEQFRILASLAEKYPQEVPFKAMLELSALPNKRKVQDMLDGDDATQQMQAQMAQMQQQMAEMMQQLQVEGLQLDNAKKEADIGKTQADTEKSLAQAAVTRTENEIARAFPDVEPNVYI